MSSSPSLGRPIPPQQRSIGTDLPIALNFSTILSYNQKNRPTEQIYFKNPYRAPLWVDEFHFTLGSPPVPGTPIQPLMSEYIPEGVVGMRMKINDRYIVDEFVPLTLLGPHTDVREKLQVTSNFANYSFLWRLAKPMWLDELDDLLIELYWIGGVGDLYDPAHITLTTPQDISNTVPITVTMCGRSTLNANRPKERALPFNAVWGPQLLETTADTEFTIRSPDSALRNGRTVPVVVNRILGQMPMWKYSSQGNATSQYAPTSNYLMNLRISHSLGYYLVKDLTPFFELFQNVSREAGFKFVLQPKEFITVELQTSTITLVNYPQPAAPFRYLSGFALQGYSMEALP